MTPQPTEMTAWVGWIGFAGAMMMLLGAFHAIEGLVALFRDEYYLVTERGLVVNVDYTTWGWIHLIAGVVIFAAGLALFTGKVWARVVGVFVALASAIVNMGFMAAYPLWSAIMIGINILIIWALIVHGHELRE